MSKCIKISFYACLSFLVFWAPQQAEAEFRLNFTPVSSTSQQVTYSEIGGSAIPGQTPFLVACPLCTGGGIYETVNDPITGLNYFHMIVGTPADGFVQESFVHTGSIAATMFSCSGNTCNTTYNNLDPVGATDIDSVNHFDNGNGETNPTKVIIRQYLSDGQITSEFLKDQYDKKPRITQILSSSDISTFFQADMRNSTYGDMNTPGTMINTLSLPGAGSANFDMSRDAQTTYVTAGRYTYTDGTGPGGSRGTYDYFQGSATFDHDWSVYMDALDPRNIWTYSGRHP